MSINDEIANQLVRLAMRNLRPIHMLNTPTAVRTFKLISFQIMRKPPRACASRCPPELTTAQISAGHPAPVSAWARE